MRELLIGLGILTTVLLLFPICVCLGAIWWRLVIRFFERWEASHAR